MTFPGNLLKAQLNGLWEHSPFYRDHFARCPVDRSRLNEYREFRRLSFLEEWHLRQYSAHFHRFDVHITRIYCSRGTLGEPKSLYYTLEDWLLAVKANATCLEMAGLDQAIRLRSSSHSGSGLSAP